MSSLALVVLMAVGVGAQGKPSFAGEWKMAVDQGQGQPGVDLTITQNAATMTARFRGEGAGPAAMTVNLDGSASKNTVPGARGGAPIEQVSKATWAGNSLVVTTTTAAGDEKRTFSISGGELLVETSAPARGGAAPSVSKTTYRPYQRGYGG